MTRASIIALLMPLLLADAARGDDAIPRFVAQQGEDRGDCSLPVRPCRTIQYALSVAGKGDQVRVARGTYELAEVLDAIEVVGSAVGVQGGFNRFDHFLRQAPGTNRTTLTGVPVAFRNALQARGFQVIVDRKGLDAAGRAALAGFQASQTSSAGADCVGNEAKGYACDNIDLLSHVALADLSSKPSVAADVWGFVDLNTEREYALLGVGNGLAVIDVTEPNAPFEVGTVPGAVSGWRDVKITQSYDHDAHRWRTYAFVSTEYGGRLVVVDLTELPNTVRLGRRSDTSAHNVYVSNVDYTTGVPLDEGRTPPLLHVLGSAANRGAFRSFDTSDPLRLVQVARSGGWLQPRRQFHVGPGRPEIRMQGGRGDLRSAARLQRGSHRDLGFQRSACPEATEFHDLRERRLRPLGMVDRGRSPPVRARRVRRDRGRLGHHGSRIRPCGSSRIRRWWPSGPDPPPPSTTTATCVATATTCQTTRGV